MDDVILNKIAIIENCLKRIHEEYDGYEDELELNFTRQDSIVLNLQRACEAAIDLAMRIVRQKNLGIPQTSRDVFIFLKDAGLISSELAKNMQAMIGFRNIAVHDYQKLNLDILRSIIKVNLSDFQELIQKTRTLIYTEKS